MASVRKLNPDDPKSPWVVEYTDAAGKRRRKTPKSGKKKDADAIRAQIEREIEERTHTPHSEDITVTKLCNIYMHHCKQRSEDGRITKATYVGWKSHMDSIEKHLGKLRLSQLSATVIEKFYQDLLSEGRCGPWTAKGRVKKLRSIEEFAIKRGYTKKGSAAKAAIHELKGVTAPKIDTFTFAQIKQLLAATKTRRKWAYERNRLFLECAVHIAAFCGLRAGEIIGLRRENVDFASGMIRVRNSLSIQDGLKGPKTSAGVRDVPMPSVVMELLQRWLDEHYLANDLDLVFTTDMGRPNNWNSVSWQAWKPLLKRAGLPDGMHFHALRHFAASFMVSNHMPITDVAKLLGHSKFDMTLTTYAHPMLGVKHQQAAMERMSRMIVEAPVTLDATEMRLEAVSV